MPLATPCRDSTENGERCAVHGVIIRHHEWNAQFIQALAGEGRANEAAPILRHEVDLLGA